MKYKAGQTILLNDGYELEIYYADDGEVDYTLWSPDGDWDEEDDEVPESTIDSIVAHHNRRGLK